MKVCLMTMQYPPNEGGVGVSAHRIAKYLASQGVKVHVFSINKESDNIFATAKRRLTSRMEDGIYVHRYSPYGGDVINYPPKDLQAMMFFLEELDKKYNFDIFHGFAVGGPGYMAALIAKKRNKKSIVNIRGVDLDIKAYDPSAFSTITWTLEHADCVVSVNKESLDLAGILVGAKPNFQVILNSIDSSEFYYLKKIPHLPLKGVIVGFSGALRSKKGFVYLLEAFKKLCKEREATLLIAGDILEDEKEPYKDMIAESGIQDKIILTGVIPHKYILNYINLMDIFVLPSISEGCPNALLEAMYCKKPCIATSVGAVPEIIQNRENGILIKPYSPEQIYDAMVELLENKKLAKELGENAYKTIKEKFTPERETKQWMECYGGLKPNFRKGSIVFFRDDDVADLTPNLQQLSKLFLSEKIPISYQVIPEGLTKECAKWLINLKKDNPGLIEICQHGLKHKDYATEKYEKINEELKSAWLRSKRSEFGDERSYNSIYNDLRKGKDILESELGEHFFPAFTPPYNNIGLKACQALDNLGFKVLSKSHKDEKKDNFNFKEISISFDVTNKQEGLLSLEQLTDKFKESEFEHDIVGILIHHNELKNGLEDFKILQDFIRYLKKLGQLKFCTFSDILQDEKCSK